MLQGRGGLPICMRIYAEVEKKLGNKEKRQEIFLAAGSSHFYIMGPKYVWSHIVILLPTSKLSMQDSKICRHLVMNDKSSDKYK